FLLPVPLIWQGFRDRRFSVVPGVVFVLYLALYLLLDDIFWQVHHEPFLVLVLLSLTWTTRKADRFYLLLAGCRYYFLYVFVSAAIWKIARGAVFNPGEMSRILLFHHKDLLIGPCASPLCRAYRWLIDHPSVSSLLYLGGVVLEATFIIGFFTRRRDRLLAALAVIFVIADLLVMRIPYWMILIGTYPLWLRKAGYPAVKKILVYETTHHENLPALLDLCDQEFSEVTVFLKELSYHHLTGEGSPEHRWPRAEFVIQTRDCGNPRFLWQLFSFLRRHDYSHLHLATLDNNLLLVALRLLFLDRVHVSLTVHEINEYTIPSWRGLRDWSETIAKRLLHGRIRHYHVFLPAMADLLQQRLPGCVAVFIPSRFYASHRQPGWALPAPPPYRIVVPGSLDPNRRNYGDIDQTLRLLLSDPAMPPIQLVLLGDSSTPAGSAILTSFQSLAGDRLTLRHFSGYIPEAGYEGELATAHLLWSPLNIHKQSSRRASETYGLTTASGLTADLLLSDVPALVPTGFSVPDVFGAALHTYRSPEDAATFLRDILFNAAAYAHTRVEIRQAFTFFSKE